MREQVYDLRAPVTQADECPDCEGRGGWSTPCWSTSSEQVWHEWEVCDTCRGVGVLPYTRRAPLSARLGHAGIEQRRLDERDLLAINAECLALALGDETADPAGVRAELTRRRRHEVWVCESCALARLESSPESVTLMRRPADLATTPIECRDCGRQA